MLVDVDPHIQLVSFAENDQGLAGRGADEFAGADVHLQHFARHERSDRSPFDLHLEPRVILPGLIDRGFGLQPFEPPRSGPQQRQVGLGLGDVRLGDAQLLAG